MSTGAALEFNSKGPPEIAPHEIDYFEKIGVGCFGHVYRGKCRGKEVAVKKLFRQDLDEKVLMDFKKEIEICSRLQHPNVVLFMGACTIPGHMAIVTELMKKGNLQQVLHDNSLSLTLYRRLKMAKDAALSINWLHCSNPQIIHRDIKPSNLLIDANGTVKVCDFGLSAVKQHGEMLKDKDAIPGTPLWMAPEVMMGKPLDEKSDVYSYAIVLWEIITCQEPFPEMESYPVFRKAVCKDNLRPPLSKDMLPSLCQLIERCWHRNPEERPSFAQIIMMLDQILIDCAIADECGRKFWKENFLGKESVLWTEFAKLFAMFLSLPISIVDELSFMCFKAVVAKKDMDPTLKDPPYLVDVEQFGNALQFFGPIQFGSGPSPQFLERIKSILKCQWFHGPISKSQAEELLGKEKKGTFLVRLSTTQAGCFTISKMNKNGAISHQRIEYKTNKGFQVSVLTKKGKKIIRETSLLNLVNQIKHELYLKNPCPNSPYEELFAKNKSKLDGYLVCDSDEE